MSGITLKREKNISAFASTTTLLVSIAVGGAAAGAAAAIFVGRGSFSNISFWYLADVHV